MVLRLRGGEVEYSEGERAKSASVRGSFQTQHSPGAQLMVRSSRHLFVALPWSSAWLWSTNPGDTRSGLDRYSQAGLYSSKTPLQMHQKTPPNFKPLQHNRTVLETLWSSMWSCEEMLNTFTENPSKRQNKLKRLGYLSESVFHQMMERKRGRRKKKSATDASGVIHSWKWLTENNNWHRWLDEWLTDWTGGLSNWVWASLCWKLRPFGGRTMAE